MGLSPEQYARLMSGFNVTAKAKANGANVKALPVEDKRLIKYVESENLERSVTAEKVIDLRKEEWTRGTITLMGAPKELANSGLVADGFEFDESQIIALEKLVNGRHVCLIGAAGTGKTTMVKHALAKLIYGDEGVKKPVGIRALSGDQGASIAICAFTGIATQVIRGTLPEWIHSSCKTIHTLLEYKPNDPSGDEKGMFIPTRTSINKLDHDIIVIDEASMLGLDLWHNLVDALRPHTRIILIGDLNQLKPVADATMFAYALSAGIDKKDDWDIAELTTIHRQKEAAANKIIDGAHAILNGKMPTFDDPQKDPNWRFMGYELNAKADIAHRQILEAIKYLSGVPTPGSPERAIFDPYKDLLLTAGNGANEMDSSCLVQQIPLNDALSRQIEPPSDEHPLYIIDAGRESRRFSVGHRVMATKNESPATKDRVTNGLTGVIVEIKSNPNWNGNKAMFGTEKEVMAFRRKQADIAMGRTGVSNDMGVDLSTFSLAKMDTSAFAANAKQEERQASHILRVKFANGAERTYMSSAEVGSIQLAYAVTVHKAQGSQADTVIIICHHAVKKQLSREWLYTGVTRARRRVVVLYTRLGLSTASSRQQIFGKDLREKVNRYRATMESGNVLVRLKARATSTELDRGD